MTQDERDRLVVLQKADKKLITQRGFRAWSRTAKRAARKPRGSALTVATRAQVLLALALSQLPEV
jgi:hypothetical protein